MRLNNLFGSKRLPDGITAGEHPSSFISFIKALQQILPEDALKKGTHSTEALAAELKRARNADRRQHPKMDIRQRR